MPFSVIEVDGAGVVSTNNSSSTPLGVSGTFTGTGEDVSRYAQIAITVYASHISAVNGMLVQFSSDNTNWDIEYQHTIPATTGKVYTIGVVAKYFRVVFTNGAVAQTDFRLQTILHVFPFKASTHPLNKALASCDDAELTKSVVSGKDPDLGTFHTVSVYQGVGDTGRMGVDLTGQSVSIGAPVPENPGNIVQQKLLNGGSPSLRVNGSVTPVVFQFDADVTQDIKVGEIRMVFSASAIDMDGISFGPYTSLTNGCLLEIEADSTLVTLANLQRNEDFLFFPGSLPFFDRSGVQDILAVSYNLGGAVKLIGGSSDFIRMTIRDNLSQVNYKLFQATVSGVKL